MTNDKKTRRAGNFGEEQRDGERENGNYAALRVADSRPHVTTSGDESDVLAKALRWQAYGREWRADNAPAWQAFEAYADECIEEGKLLSGNALHAIVKKNDYVNLRTGKTTSLNRYVLPLFTRWLLREHPGLRAELRRSFFDVLFDADQRGASNEAA